MKCFSQPFQHFHCLRGSSFETDNLPMENFETGRSKRKKTENSVWETVFLRIGVVFNSVTDEIELCVLILFMHQVVCLLYYYFTIHVKCIYILTF